MKNLIAVLMALATGLLTSAAAAQDDYPSRLVKLIVANAPGGGTDLVARAVAKALAAQLGQPFIVENRPGANSVIGSEFVANSTPNGYTLLVATAALAIQPAFEKSLPYDPVKSFAPVTMLGEVPLVLAASTKQSAKTIGEWIDFVRANPGTVSFGWSDQSTYLPMETLRMQTRTQIIPVPYKGTGQMITDIIGGHVNAGFVSPGPALGHIKAGTIVGLATTGARRSSLLPNIATISETIAPGYEATVWYGVFAPAGTALVVRQRLADAIHKALATAEVRDTFSHQGAEIINMSVQEFERRYISDVNKTIELVKATGLRMP